MKREKFGSRLGFILVSAGCAIGIGNVWKFPYMCGEFGGAAFIVIYLIFLLVLGIPVLTCEFAIGRGSGRSVAAGFERLEPQGTGWHITKWVGIVGSYLLMMFYTTVGGWMMYYCYRSIKGELCPPPQGTYKNSLPREFFCISPPQKGVLGVRPLLFLPLSDMLGLSRDKEVQL